MSVAGMNIWIVNHYGVAPGTGGGTRHFDLAKQLVRQGASVTIFASAYGHQNWINHLEGSRNAVREVTYDGVRFVWLRTTAYKRNDWRRVKNMLDYTWRCYWEGRRRKESPDLIIGSLMHPAAAWIGSRLAAHHNAVFYFEERDLWPQTLIDFGKMSPNHPIVKALYWLESHLYRKASRIIVLFDKAADYVEKQSGLGSKVLVLPNGVDMERFALPLAELPSEVERQFEQWQGKFIAIYTGSHGISDGIHHLLEAAALSKGTDSNIQFVFVGEGPEKEALVKQAEQAGLTNVAFLPLVKKEAVPTLLARAHVGLIALRDASVYKWGMSFNKMYDYMASSLPTLLVGKIDDSVIAKEQIGLVLQDPEELSEALSKLARQMKDREEMGRRARAYVEREHDWERMSYKLSAAIAEDVGRNEKQVSKRNTAASYDV